MTEHYIASGDVFTPQRLGEVIYDSVYENLAVLTSPAVRDLNATFINGGNQVTFPVFNGVDGDFEDLNPADTTGVNPTVNYADMTHETVNVVSKIINVGIKGTTIDDAFRNGQFEIVNAVLEEVAQKATKMVDRYLVSLAETTDLSYDASGVGAGKLTRNAIIKAQGKWGDMCNMPSILAIHSAPYEDILDEVKDPMAWGTAQVNETGQLPRALGKPIIVSDRITDNAETPKKYNNLLLAAGSLGFSFHKELTYAVIRERGNKFVHEFVMRYYGKLGRRNGKKLAVKLITK